MMNMNLKFSYIFLIIITSELVFIFYGCIKEKEPVPTVSTVSVTEISSSSAVWHGIVLIRGEGYYCSCGFCWSQLSNNPEISDNAMTIDFPSSDNYGFTSKVNLTPGMQYFMRAYVASDAGIGYGKIMSFSTTGSITGEIKYNSNLSYGSLSDIDGNTYRTIQIGNQTWMAENLKTRRYNDGTDIPYVPADILGWARQTTPAYCWYLNDEAKYKKTYGALYNWYCVNTGDLCPTGWHVPSLGEWESLITFLGGDSIAGAKLKEYGAEHWFESEISNNMEATNSSGFTALPGGILWAESLSWYLRNFEQIGLECGVWSSTVQDSNPEYGARAWAMGINYASGTGCSVGAPLKGSGISVRCIKNK